MTTYQVDQLHVEVHTSREEMGAAAAADAARAIDSSIRERGEARVILASAPSQNELLNGLVKAPIDWSRVTIFHMDEYAGLDGHHPASFRRFQQEHVLAHVQPRAFHGIRGEAANTVE